MNGKLKLALAGCCAVLLALALAACTTQPEPAAAPTAAPATALPTEPPATATPVPPPTPAPTATAAPTIAPTATPVPPPTATPAPEPEPPAEEPPAFQMPPPTMTRLADGVYHYFGFFGSSLVVIADDAVLTTDVYNFPRAQSLKEEIAKITDTPVSIIALTHEHYDHVGGTGVFPDATIVCQQNCQQAFDLFMVAEVGDVPEVDETFDTYQEIMVGDKVVELHYMGPGDGEATTVVYMPEEQIVVTSDMYEPRALTHKNWVHDKNFVGTRYILNTISEWDLKHAINAHSLGTDPVDLYENVDYYNDLYDAVSAAVVEAATQAGGAFGAYPLYDTLPQTLELEQYQDWTNYDTSFPSHVERMLLSIYHGD